MSVTPPSPESNYQLFHHMSAEHELTLINDELEQIIRVCEQILNGREKMGNASGSTNNLHCEKCDTDHPADVGCHDY